MRYRPFWTFLLVSLLAVTLLAPGNRSLPAASAQGQAQREPLEYFREMMPVLVHDRCINCHGGVDPFTNRDHEGGMIDPAESCTKAGCHTQADNANHETEDDWKLAPAAVWFVKSSTSGVVTNLVPKTDKELCEQLADRIANRGDQEFIDHLQNDFQIDLGFVGRSGGANTDPQGAPPQMPKTKFLAAAARWVDEGFAVCEREGTIIRTEEINSDRTYGPETPEGQGHEVRVKQSGRREVTIRFANGRYETNVEVKGTVTTTQTIRAVLPNGAPCTTVITGQYSYGHVPTPGGAPGQSGTAHVDVKFESDGKYTVTVRLGEEKHRSMESTSLQDGCQSPLRAPPSETIENVWSPTSFLFRGKLPNPTDRTRLGGRELRMWFERGASSDEDPWLPDHYASMAQDGTIHPVEIRTRWNIRYRAR